MKESADWLRLTGLPQQILMNAIDVPEPQYNERYDKVILQYDNARPHEMGQSGEKLSQNVEMGDFTSPTVLSRCCFASFSPHSRRSMAHGLADQHFSSYEEVKIGSTHGSYGKLKIFSSQDLSAAREMGQSGS
nr:Mariner Mos1 transposase [Hymenolepis microstoma]